MSQKQLHVAAAVIRDKSGHILIAQRPKDKSHAGLWEFPGGKLETGETAQQALIRELREELGIETQTSQPLIQIRHNDPNAAILLDVFEVSAFSGTPRGMEGQALAWIKPAQLVNYPMPAANAPAVRAARLPRQYLITPQRLEPEALLCGIKQALAADCRLLQLRAPNLFSADYRDLAVDVLGLCAGKAQLMLKGPLEWLGDFPAAGWHLSAEQLRKYAACGRPFPESRWLAASCHNAEELKLAAQIGADFVTLSPIAPTQTHPEAAPLGLEAARDLIAGFNQPVFIQGGVTPDDGEQAAAIGAQGVAGIRAFWPSGG
ncbi:hypothetical protein AXE65_03950 [Ventosimonas gracilis]|uniref:8-oxo-dGTP diphosphatase n=1 Tax=Ventosimonas gracilis TaxID=1680762 RepID=A0A139SRK5_9GAMM|nr:Nudix family hydrolase [Ventosimonas gracilis]KXU37110.1 hypothetical protein AXE65_03950 [Ventosimonas gracilis]